MGVKKKRIRKACGVCKTIFFVAPWQSEAKFCCKLCADVGRHGKIRTSKEWLYEKYWIEELTTGEIAELVDVCAQTISNRMQKFGISLRSKIESHKTLRRRVQKICKTCKKTFEVTVGRSLQGEGKYCSRACCNNKPRKVVAIICEYCGRVVEEYVSHAAGKRFCSLDCYSAWRRCARPFAGENNPNWRDGKSCERYRYPLEFSVIRKDIQERDNSKCAICRLFGNHVHHIDYDKINNSQENLITLCASCHGVTNGNRDYWQLTLSDLLQKRVSYLEECNASI